MTIYEKIFARLEQLNMSQTELSKRTGIATSTISDWKKKKINPQADKLVPICKALDMSLVDLLCDEEDRKDPVIPADYAVEDGILIELINKTSTTIKRRIIRYLEQLSCKQFANEDKLKLNRNVSIIKDENDNKIVLINDIIFEGKKNIRWNDVESYLRKYVGKHYFIAETNERIYIGTDLPDEYTGSKYTKRLKGALAKAKANVAQAIPELLEIAVFREKEENRKNKHSRNAKYGWYSYNTRFALPVYIENKKIDRYNIFDAKLLVRHAASGKKYLYDILEIKKETSKSCQELSLPGENPFLN